MPSDPLPQIEFDHAIVEEKFILASGPGGQNVNKVATACQLRCNVYALGLPPDMFRRLKTLAGSKMNMAGEIVITARNQRTQEGNRTDARRRLADLLARAAIRPERRIKTKPSKAARAKRVDAKKGRGAVKQGRGRVTVE